MIRDTIKHSVGINDIKMSDEMKKSMGDLRSFMFTHVYTDERATREGKKVDGMLNDLFKYYMENPYQTEREFVELIKSGENVETVVCDYIACMTDRYAIAVYTKLFIPTSWNIY
jgi:dGTPase